ncbi:DUF169 domain-containing protein [bacterium]|nr:DUF169 domain-containing protein [candidate division CSSED10-310 bacterium]
MQPNPERLLMMTGINRPLIGFYDAPELAPFEPIVDTERCFFSTFPQWMEGKSTYLAKDHFTCGGAGQHLCGVETRSRQDMVEFLVGMEGLKATRDLMNEWLNVNSHYRQTHPYLVIGPLKPDQYANLKTITFYVNPDQLSVLMIGAQYRTGPYDPTPVIAPFGSGCMQLVTIFDDLTVSQAAVGATDIAMRQFLPPDVLAFTVTKPMFERLCELDETSFLYKPFWRNLRKSREKS